jgi:hypothetical protein
MTQLIITACLLAAPNTCQDIKVPIEASTSMASCLETAKVDAAKWQTDNPTYIVIGWKCSE